MPNDFTPTDWITTASTAGEAGVGARMPEHNWTEKQGQYLAFITNYTVMNHA